MDRFELRATYWLKGSTNEPTTGQLAHFTSAGNGTAYLGNPANKRLEDGTVVPVRKPDEHLVCHMLFEIQPGMALPRVMNPFGSWKLGLPIVDM